MEEEKQKPLFLQDIVDPIDKIDQRQLKYVDSREPELIRAKLVELGWFSKVLYTSDFYFLNHDYKKVGVTRKTIGDLVSSIGGKFSKQLEEMIDFFDVKIMLLEGSWKMVSPYNNMNGQIVTARGVEHYTWDMVWGYIRRWQEKGFIIELSQNEGHTIHLLNVLYAHFQKPSSFSAAAGRGFTDERVLALPSGVRGATGERLLSGKSIQEVAAMSKEELLGYDKIGEKKADLIFEHFRKVK